MQEPLNQDEQKLVQQQTQNLAWSQGRFAFVEDMDSLGADNALHIMRPANNPFTDHSPESQIFEIAYASTQLEVRRSAGIRDDA